MRTFLVANNATQEIVRSVTQSVRQSAVTLLGHVSLSVLTYLEAFLGGVMKAKVVSYDH